MIREKGKGKGKGKGKAKGKAKPAVDVIELSDDDDEDDEAEHGLRPFQNVTGDYPTIPVDTTTPEVSCKPLVFVLVYISLLSLSVPSRG